MVAQQFVFVIIISTKYGIVKELRGVGGGFYFVNLTFDFVNSAYFWSFLYIKL